MITTKPIAAALACLAFSACIAPEDDTDDALAGAGKADAEGAALLPFADGPYAGSGVSYSKSRGPETILATMVLDGPNASATISLPTRTLQHDLFADFDDQGFFTLWQGPEGDRSRTGRGFCGETMCTYSAGRESAGFISVRETLVAQPDGSILSIGHVFSPVFESAWEIRYRPVSR